MPREALVYLPVDLEKATRPARLSDKRRRYIVCRVCGQSFDATKLAENYHHDNEPHEPTNSIPTTSY